MGDSPFILAKSLGRLDISVAEIALWAVARDAISAMPAAGDRRHVGAVVGGAKRRCTSGQSVQRYGAHGLCHIAGCYRPRGAWDITLRYVA